MRMQYPIRINNHGHIMTLSIRTLYSAAFAVCMAVASFSAHAWTASAVTPSGYTFTAHNEASPDKAREAAVQGCLKKGAGECKLMGDPKHATAHVIWKGQGGWGQSSNDDPLVADRQAKEGCESLASNCKRVLAVWDRGDHHAAFAMGEKSVFFSYGNASSSDAERHALMKCEEGTPKKGSCTIKSEFSVQGPGYLAHAASPTSTHSGFGKAAKKASAEKLALESCRNGPTKPTDCKIVEVMVNPASQPEPASMKKLVVAK